jgi:hypothetical protein
LLRCQNVSLPTVTKNTHKSSASFPAASVAVHVTVVFVFSAKLEPDGGSHDTLKSTPPSEAVGSVKLTIASFVKTSTGQFAKVAFGAIVSGKESEILTQLF